MQVALPLTVAVLLSCLVLWLSTRTHLQSNAKQPVTPLVTPKESSQQTMRVVAISDPHGSYRQLNVPPGDILLFSGDVELSSKADAEDFSAWLHQLPHAHKAVTFGNMDGAAEEAPKEVLPILQKSATVLVDEAKAVGGLRVFGSPWTPQFYGSFQLDDEESAQRHWRKVLPPKTQVDALITHGPPFGIGDVTGGRHVGDKALLEAVQGLEEKPQLWICGHIHAARGVYQVPHPKGSILLINAALPRDPGLKAYTIDLPSLTVGEGPPVS